MQVDTHRDPGARDHWMGAMPEGTVPDPRRYPVDACSWGVYCRFHGTAGAYVGEYGAEVMGAWAQRAQRWTHGGRTVYFAFNNTDSQGNESADPAAIADGRHLAAALRRNGVFREATSADTPAPGSSTGAPTVLHVFRV